MFNGAKKELDRDGHSRLDWGESEDCWGKATY